MFLAICTDKTGTLTENRMGPTEVALLESARSLGTRLPAEEREALRRWHFHFDPTRPRSGCGDTSSAVASEDNNRGP